MNGGTECPDDRLRGYGSSPEAVRVAGVVETDGLVEQIGRLEQPWSNRPCSTF
jgi:hypothetical protein